MVSWASSSRSKVHMSAKCLNPKVYPGGNCRKTDAPKMTDEEAKLNNEVILITFIVNDINVRVLFNDGASRFFVPPTLNSLLREAPILSLMSTLWFIVMCLILCWNVC
uniref:Uncharacterized protein n=1 Tax=Lactuca sativa TaxID=4236 RepID=A0A9R1W756_LACSA|nr:hypothetical protein LSAT_V11C300126530 [Lactuca sativa]